VVAKKTSWRELSQGYSFEIYEEEFARSYDSKIRAYRKSIFDENLKEIVAHNSNPSNTWFRGLSDFTDRTRDEIRALIPRGFDKEISLTERNLSPKSSTALRTSTAGLPDRVDWREHVPSIMTPVKNQGQCGSCWAFASTETLESHAALQSGRLEEFSEQFILDCTPNPHSCGGTGGCMGGTAKLAYDQLKEIGGMPSEW
jgi:cathepsin L